ncbi:hypothetical protein EZV62_020595 [Acer yangbiense]|uniref:Plant heme peroxidase family profile domain-containing protein n=1 Tax=Acer yangbiense TaxID=1000413 RepID=A0A5C7HET2_9ROSI|nr:hypothetical protein EZV62_020595 [Acer yangbiense]
MDNEMNLTNEGADDRQQQPLYYQTWLEDNIMSVDLCPPEERIMNITVTNENSRIDLKVNQVDKVFDLKMKIGRIFAIPANSRTLIFGTWTTKWKIIIRSRLDDAETKAYVKFQSATHGKTFAADFANSMVKLGKIGVLTGKAGQIRKQCAFVN